jgi:ribosomal protein S18 acetylase RimI-like enzyme
VTSSPHQVSPTSERDRAVATLVSAFVADPITRWFYPSAARYLEEFPQVLRVIGDRAFQNGSAYASADHSAVAIWFGPGVEPDREALVRMREQRNLDVSEERDEELRGFRERHAAAHPTEPHWYLNFIGVDPAYQGRGLGGALLNHALAVVDQDGLPAYLEATTLNNRRLYERHGFVLVDVIQYGSSPPMYAMRREPR